MVQSLTCLLLKRKNILSKIWLAAHWDKKLTRYHILQIDIERSIKDIIHQEIILDLRLSGHLLVGIVKIFSRKTIYLLNECTEIISKVRVFRADMTDLSPRKLTAPLKSITLPEIFEKVDNLEFPKLEDDDIFHSLQSNPEDITLKETAYDNRLITDDEYFDVLGEENIPMDFDENVQLASFLNDVEEYCINGEIGNGSCDSSNSLPEKKGVHHISDSKELISRNHHTSESRELISLWLSDKTQKLKDNNELYLEPLSNNFCSFQRIRKQKRKLVMDEVKSISRDKIEKQVEEYLDLVAPLDLAPPSKRLMVLKEIGNAEQLLHQPGLKIPTIKLRNLFERNMKVLKTEQMVDDSTSSEGSLSISFEGLRGRLFGDECASANGFDEHNLLSHHELLNGDSLPENAVNSNSPINGIGDFNDQRDSFVEEIQLSIEFQQDSGCSSNGISSICQEKIIKLLQCLKRLFKEKSEIKFSKLVQTDRKSEVAQKFHSLLMVKKFNIVEIMQVKPYGEIIITKGTNFVVDCEDIY